MKNFWTDSNGLPVLNIRRSVLGCDWSNLQHVIPSVDFKYFQSKRTKITSFKLLAVKKNIARLLESFMLLQLTKTKHLSDEKRHYRERLKNNIL